MLSINHQHRRCENQPEEKGKQSDPQAAQTLGPGSKTPNMVWPQMHGVAIHPAVFNCDDIKFQPPKMCPMQFLPPAQRSH